MKTLVKKLILTVLIYGCLGNLLPEDHSAVSPDKRKFSVKPAVAGNASWSDYPYFVAILRGDWVAGGGAIISENYIATVKGLVLAIDFSGYKIQYGTQVKSIVEVIDNPDNKDESISLLKLDSNLQYNGPFVKLQDEPVPVGTDCIVVGAGATYEEVVGNTLHSITLSITDQSGCSEICHGRSDDYLCASILEQDYACDPSSGDPLVCNGVLTGITSNVHCTPFGIRGVYGNVSYYKDWIEGKGTKITTTTISSSSSGGGGGGSAEQSTTPGAGAVSCLNEGLAMISALLIFILNFKFI